MFVIVSTHLTVTRRCLLWSAAPVLFVWLELPLAVPRIAERGRLRRGLTTYCPLMLTGWFFWFKVVVWCDLPRELMEDGLWTF